jgi:hypothetical protein
MRLQALRTPGTAVLVLLAAAGSARGAEDEGAAVTPSASTRVRAEGSLAWVSHDDLDLVGELAADLPWRLTERVDLYFGLDTQTAIAKTLDDFTFDVRELNYHAELGVRRTLSSGRTLWVMAGERGKAFVDADGRAWVRYVAAGLDSRVRRGDGLSWSAAAGPVLDDREVSADGWLRGALHFDFPGRGSRPLLGFGFDLEVDALIDDGLDADLRLGPHYLMDFGEGYQLSFFAHYLDGGNPLGLNLSGFLVGFDYSSLPGAAGGRLQPPDIRGLVSAGGGDGRAAGRLQLDFSFPPLPVGWLAADFDVNVLRGDDIDELYYFYELGYEYGLEHVLEGLVAGGYFFHRSNHQLSSFNETVTSLNSLELGLETRAWRGPVVDLPLAPWGRVDWVAHLGYLISSSFGEDRRWRFHGGARWMMPWTAGRWVPLARVEISEADAARHSFALGVAGPWDSVLQVEYLEDEQFFGSDQSAVLLLAERRF